MTTNSFIFMTNKEANTYGLTLQLNVTLQSSKHPSINKTRDDDDDDDYAHYQFTPSVLIDP